MFSLGALNLGPDAAAFAGGASVVLGAVLVTVAAVGGLAIVRRIVGA